MSKIEVVIVGGSSIGSRLAKILASNTNIEVYEPVNVGTIGHVDHGANNMKTNITKTMIIAAMTDMCAELDLPIVQDTVKRNTKKKRKAKTRDKYGSPYYPK
tara:strand:- start:116 stop:421 length:306 start_codon:yes stop_codon:yes gene_type:complete